MSTSFGCTIGRIVGEPGGVPSGFPSGLSEVFSGLQNGPSEMLGGFWTAMFLLNARLLGES